MNIYRFNLVLFVGLMIALSITTNASANVLFESKACVEEACLSTVRLTKQGSSYKLYFEGEFPIFPKLNQFQFSAVQEALHRIPEGKNFEVSLHSGGGVNIVGQFIAETLKSKCMKDEIKICKITTTIERQRSCSSFCMLIYMIGDYRTAHETAKFGFHSATITGLEWKEELRDELAIDMAKALYKVGVTESFLNWSLHRGILQQEEITYLLPRDVKTIPSNIMTEQR